MTRPDVLDEPVSAAPARPARLRLLARELTAFGGVGAVAFVVQLGVLNAFLHLGAGPLTSNGVATVVSCAVAFVGNRHVSFRHRRGHLGREAVAFVVINAVTLVIGEVVLATAYLVHAEHDRVVLNVLTVTGVAIGTVLRFWAYRRFVFVGAASTGRDRRLPIVDG